MESSSESYNLLNCDSASLQLTHPTQDECVKIWTNTSASWADSLTPQVYLQEQSFLTTVPLAKDGGMTTWILTDRNLPPDHRPIFCSCESYLKPSLMSDNNNVDGNIEEVIVHGIASVFCPLEYRRRGYATRHMTEVGKALRKWQGDQGKPVAGSVLYSDIGKDFYAKFGWQPNQTNWHIEFPPSKAPPESPLTREITEDDLAKLCRRDEAIIRESMIKLKDGVNKYITILPNLDHMLWHIAKENFATERLFGRTPRAKGAIVGEPGSQVWAIWTRRYYSHPDEDSQDQNNVLYIQRLLVEGEHSANKPTPTMEEDFSAKRMEKQAESLLHVIQAAQAEAAEWRLDAVKLWEPSPWVQHVIKESKLVHRVAHREEDSIASCMWYDGNGERGTPPIWINNQHYAWC